ncbi:MAG: bifunctional oligoribonuclease/PAP phosphatase NrnA [Verrucomicrobium sp.]|nr:bifunctional oligoribonuclease/PAP phosphatase NrnA [Verrucomicrobium sp.]
MNDSLAHIGSVLRDASRIAIACHVRPDGDAIGSIVGLGRSLQLAGKAVYILSEDGVPLNLTFLPGSALVETSRAVPLELDVAVALDTAAKDRLGERTLEAFSKAPILVNIDHHGTNPRYGHLNHIDTAAPAAGQLVYELLQVMQTPMDDMVRENLFTAISTDTGSFQYSSTNPRTHRIVAEMMEAGLNTADLATKLYQTHPLRRVLLQKALLNEMKFTCDQQVASWCLTQKLQNEVQVQPGDTEGLIDVMRSIEGVVAAVVFEELPDGRVRASSRSKDARVNVSRVCAEFGGGGHVMAAGARLPGPIAEAESRFLEVLKNEIERTG